jgi:hypothetical protein
MAAASWGGERKGRTTLRDRKKGTQWLREAVLIARTDTIIWTTWSVLEVENPTELIEEIRVWKRVLAMSCSMDDFGSQLKRISKRTLKRGERKNQTMK